MLPNPNVLLEKIRDLMIPHLSHALKLSNGWVPVKKLAALTGVDEALVGSVADLFSKDFILDGKKSVVHLAPGFDPTGPPEPYGHKAALAVHEYADQLSPMVFGMEAVKSTGPVLEYFLHRITIESKADEDDSDLSRLAVETPLRITHDGGKDLATGYVVGFSKRDDLALWVALDREVLAADLPCQIRIDRSVVWRNLAHRLDLIKTKPANYGALLEPSPMPVTDIDSIPLARRLVEHTAGSSQLLWGPPGSGKTRCLATAAVHLARLGRNRILLVALSNSAVDAAAKAVLSVLSETPAGRALLIVRSVVRAGYSRDQELLARKELFGSDQLEALAIQIHDLSKKLSQAGVDGLNEQEKAELTAKLVQLQQERRKALRDHIKKAKIVLATFAGVVDPSGPFGEDQSWSAVFADEVSMLGRASALFLSNLSHSKLLLAGDPQQLPPIVEWKKWPPSSDVQHWLGTEPFEFTKLVKVESSKAIVNDGDGRLVRLLSQRRCHPGIWGLVACRYPKVETMVDEAKVKTTACLPPAPGSPVIIVDVTGSVNQSDLPSQDAVSGSLKDDQLALDYPSACRKHGRSWRNPPTAALALELAIEAAASDSSPKVAVITPYRSQVRYLNMLLEHRSNQSHGDLGKSFSRIQIGTVHAFQGSEADVVVLDLVDGPPRVEPGVLLTGETGERLLNVAITRAKGKLIVVACLKWYKSKLSGGLLRGLLFGEHGQFKLDADPPGEAWAVPGDQTQPQTESPIEEIFKLELNRRQLPHELQYRIKDTTGRIVARADFAFPDRRVAVFCDGLRYHHNAQRWSRDIKQGRILKLLNWEAVRFTGAEINSNVVACVDELEKLLDGIP